jgi:tellurite resistance protein TerC
MDEAQAAAGIVMTRTLRQIKRVIVAIVGTTVLLIGVALLVLPGPAFIVIPLGLGILATEFLWARRLLSKVKDKFNRSRKPQ